jgi:hypothetical protein
MTNEPRRTIPNPIGAAKHQTLEDRYTNLMDLSEYAADHLDNIKGELDLEMSDDSVEYCLASVARCEVRLAQLKAALFDYCPEDAS